jgi:D-alanyl-D-alanine carboxypeptidase (penicillin-binding protein 5/6)
VGVLLIPRRRAGAALLALALGGLVVPAAPAGAATGAAVRSDAVGGPGLASTGIVVAPGPSTAPLPDIAAKSWVLADLTTGEVLAAKNPHRLGRPASTLKTLTAVTLLPVLAKDAEHTVTYKEASADGGHVGIVPDATYTAWDLWHGLLLPSGNDAAAALAGAHGGMKKTVADMQTMAGRLQAYDTTVRNPSGLDADGQVTSAYDLALIAKAALGNEDFRTLTRTISYDFPGRMPKAGKERKTYKIYTQNRLLLRGYKGTVGGKTGYTTKAGRTFWAAAERGGHTLVVTLLQIGQPTETAAESLLTWGFRNRTTVTPVGTLVDPLPEGVEPAPQQSGAAPVGSANAVGPTSGAAAPASGAGVPAWAWLLGLVLVAGGALAVVLGRRRTPTGSHTPAATAAGGGATVLPQRPAPAARTSPSVVVSTPGRRVDVDVEASPSAVADPVGALDATGPVPVVAAAPPAAPAPDRPEPAPAADEAPVDGSAVAESTVAESTAPPPPPSGGNVRVIRPPGPGQA